MRRMIEGRVVTILSATTAALAVGVVASAQNLDVKGTSTVESNGYFYGSVGIGTANPGAPLDVEDTSAGNEVTLKSGYGAMRLFAGYSNNWAYIESGNLAWNGNINGLVISGYASSPLNALAILSNSVGIGTTSPTAPLEVVGALKVSSSANGDIQMNSGTRPTIYPNGANVPANLDMQVRSQGSGNLQLNFDNPGNVLIADGGGNVGIGTSSPQYPLDIETTRNWATSSAYEYLNPSTVNHFGGGAQNIAVSMWATGRIIAAEFDAVSDEREKNVLGTVDPALAARLLDQLVAKTYTWKDGHDQGVKVGFLAQEVGKVVPEAVAVVKGKGLDDLHVLNYSTLYTLNVAATKHLLEVVDQQQKEIDALKAQIAKR